MKIILEYYGIKKSEHDLRILLKTTPRFGALWEIVEKEIKQLGFELVWKKFWSLEEIKSLIGQSTPLIIGIKSKTDDRHAVVIVDISEEDITVVDPDNGKLVKIDKQDFLSMWDERKRIAGYLKRIA